MGGATLTTGTNNILIGTSGAVDTTAAGTSYNLNIGNLIQGDMTNSTALGTEALYLQSTSASVDYLQIAGGASGNPGNVTLSGQGTDANVSIIMTPKGTGGVGIGTTSPASALTVNTAVLRDWGDYGGIEIKAVGGSTGTDLIFSGQTTTGWGSIMWTNSTSGNVASGTTIGGMLTVARASSTDTDMEFLTNNAVGTAAPTEKMRITGAGNVGIGATAPKSALDVNGGITVGSYAGATAAPANSIIVSGTVAIGTTVETAGTALDLGTNTNSILLPVGTTGQRPTGVNGMLRYNSTVPQLEAYYSGGWNALGGGAASTINLGRLLRPPIPNDQAMQRQAFTRLRLIP